MKPIDDQFAAQHLGTTLKIAHGAQSRAIASLVGSISPTPRTPVVDLCTEAGFEVGGPKLYVAPGIEAGSPPIYLSHNEVDADALVVRPLGWIEPTEDRDLVRDLVMTIPRLPTGGYGLARVGDRDLLLFLEHLATQAIDASEFRCALASARVAGVAVGADSGQEPTGWFSRQIDASVAAEIDSFLLSRPVPWRRAPVEGREHPAWVCDADSALAAFFDPRRGVLVMARSFRSFVGSPKPAVCARLLRTNINLLDGRFAALRDGAHGTISLINNLCCDDLDHIELVRAVGYLEKLTLRGASSTNSGLELLGLLERSQTEGAMASAADVAPSQRVWPDEIELGVRADGTALTLPVSDFLTHAFVCGGSGSGKTIVCKNILERLALAGVPSIVIDLKGDLSSLACVPGGVSTSEVVKYLIRLHGDAAPHLDDSIQSLARQTERNCDDSGISGEALQSYRDAVEFRLLTPRSDVGIPLALSPLSGLDLGAIGETGSIVWNRALHELVEGNLRGLVDYLELSDVDADTLIAVLIQLLEVAHRDGSPLGGIEGIERIVQLLFEVHQKTERINFLETAAAIDKDQARRYARAMNARLGGTFRYWFDGDELSIDELVAPREGRVPINVVNLSMLPTPKDQGYAIAQINTQIIEWMRSQSGAQRPRLLYFIDEIAQGGGKAAIFPPHPYNPITKPGLNVLLKQGRAFGVSCLLATQNAKDIDYKGLGQCDTWIVGRLKTALDIDRLRVGIEAAEADTGPGFSNAGNDPLDNVASLDPGNFVIKTRDRGVLTYRQRWIYSLHERMTPEMIKNWVTAEELRIESSIDEARLQWSRGDPREAVYRLEAIINDEPYYSKLADCKLMLCEWVFRLKDWSRVVDYAATVRDAVRGRPGFEFVHYYEGIAHFELGSLEAAQTALERFVSSAAQGSDELVEQCRKRLGDLYLKQDDYDSLESSAVRDGEDRSGSRIVEFCRSMRSVLTAWPSMRGGALDHATVVAAMDSDDPDEVRYARKQDRRVHSYVAEIRRRLDDLPLAPPPVEPFSEVERAQLERILANAEADDGTKRAHRESVEEAIALAEEHIDSSRLDLACDAIDAARKLVLETGVGGEALDAVISLYRGACSAGANSIRGWLMQLDPFKFELEIAALFRNFGYQAQATQPTGDGGVDVRATYRNRHYVIQCKRYRHAIEPAQIREFATVIRNFDADEGVFVTTSSYTRGSREEASRHGIQLMDMDDLLRFYAGEAGGRGQSRRRRIDSSTGPDLRAPTVDAACDAKVRELLQSAQAPLLMRELSDASGYSLTECQVAIGQLLAQGDVRKLGRARGTRYELV